MSQFMKEVHGQYAQYYNSVTQRVGHVFGERYNNKIVQVNLYATWLSRYIHRQALEAGLVSDPKDYYWSSYHTYVGLRTERFVRKDVILSQFSFKGHTKHDIIKEYRNFVRSEINDPIDWSKTYHRIIGDIDFQKSIVAERKEGRVCVVDSNDTIRRICRRLGVTKDVLLQPRGADQRDIRHDAVSLLHREYGMGMTQIARTLAMSRFAVMSAVKER